tara:strand:+ start:1637 stop:2023 length:387 start_codon:yes stop_codon:yes gene_type:complete
LNCDFRFTTYERVEASPISVIKRNGSRETFNRSKILNGVSRACEKTSLTSQKVEFLVNEIEIQLQQKNSRDINSSEIGEMVLEHLKNLSEVAYIRFASVYREFHGVDDFIETLEAFDPNKKNQLATVI